MSYIVSPVKERAAEIKYVFPKTFRYKSIDVFWVISVLIALAAIGGFY
jgi:hypothetical protein